jgi:predicted dehydrogenase
MIASGLDIVYACATNRVLPEIIIAALKADMHVFSEKPPGRTLEDIENIRAEEALHPGLHLAFGFNHRQHYSVKMAKELMNSGELGQLLWLRGVYGKCGQEGFERQWRSNREEAGGGILLDQGIHMLDLFRYFGFEYNRLKSFVATDHWNIPVEDNAFILLANEQQQAFLHSSSTLWKHKFQLEICLREGFISLNGLNTGSNSYGRESITWGRKNRSGDDRIMGQPGEHSQEFNRDDSWAFEQEEFLGAILGQNDKRGEHSLAAWQAMKTITDAYADGMEAV